MTLGTSNCHASTASASLAGATSGINAKPCRWFAIVNPASGAMRHKRFRERWLPEVRRSTTEMAFCEGPGHATKLAADAQDCDGIVAVGGDGTVFEILAGLDRARHCVAVLPAGRGNSLARELGVAEMPRAVAALDDGATRRMDLLALQATNDEGITTHALCACTIAIGYVASVGGRAHRFIRAGRYSYTLATLLTRPCASQMLVSYDGASARWRALTGLLISNVAHVAQYRAFPDAKLDDGLLDAMELNAGWIRQLCHNMSVLAGSYLLKPRYMTQSKSVEVYMDSPVIVLVDGEIIERVTALAVRCMPSSVHCRTVKAA